MYATRGIMSAGFGVFGFKLLQIVLSGQPEIEEKLTRIESYHLQQVAVRCKTTPLSFQETHGYIQYRLRVAGANARFELSVLARPRKAEPSHGATCVPGHPQSPPASFL
jgi:hypothetical protein